MAIPDTWSKQRESVRWQSSTGAWERVENWRGLAGVNGVTYGEWLANFIGYTSLRYDKSVVGDDGTGIMDVEIGFATDQNGSVLEPTNENYGLIERSWELVPEEQQRDIFMHPDVDLLWATDQTWPGRIRKAVQAYNQAYREWTKRTESVWIANDPSKTKDPNEPANASIFGLDEPPPNLSWYLDMAIPYKDDGSFKHIPVTLEQLDTHTWMFRRYLDDINARFPYDVPIMRRTDIVIAAANQALWAKHHNMRRIHSTAAFLAAEPSVVVATLINAGELSEWYWIKGAPKVTQTSQGWFRVTQDWRGILAPTPDDVKVSGGPIL